MTEPRLPCPEAGPLAQTKRVLAATDCAMLTVDRILRGSGSSGFDTQALVWLSGRVDAARLRLALTRLSARHPVVASRLVEGDGTGPYWQFRPDAVCLLREIDMESADAVSVWDAAARVLSTPMDPASADPVRFYVLHRPHGQDVFLMQYTHALMDNRASVLLLREIDRLSRPVPGPEEDAGGERDLVRSYLRRFSRQERRKAIESTFKFWGGSLRGGSIALGRENPAGGPPLPVRFATRSLGEAETAALRAHVLKTCGLPNVSMAMLGSVFRALAPLAPEQLAKRRNFMVGIGVDLGLRTRQSPIFQNLMSIVPINVLAEDTTERDELVRTLSRQMRERLAAGADLGMLQWVTLMQKRPREDTRWGLQLVLRSAFSLWYAHFGSQDAIGEQFCDTAIDDVCYAGPAWPGVGITLLVNQFRGRLLLQATYIPQVVPEPLAAAFLDRVLADLLP